MLFPGMYFLGPQCHSPGWGEGQAGSLIPSTTCPAGCPSRDGNKARCPPASSQGRLLLRDWWPPGEEKLHCSSPPPASSQFLLPLIQFSYSWPQQTGVSELLSTNSTNYWGVKIETFEFWEQTQRCRLKRTEKKRLGRREEEYGWGERQLPSNWVSCKGWAHREYYPEWTHRTQVEALVHKSAWAEAPGARTVSAEKDKQKAVRTPVPRPTRH